MDTARFDILERGPGNRRPRTSDFCVLEHEANWGWGGGTGLGICVHSKREDSFAAARPKAKIRNNYKTAFAF